MRNIIIFTVLFILITQCNNDKGGTIMAKNDLKSKLSELEYHVTQENGTEPAFNNKYWDNKKAGIYVDVVSGEVLFSSIDKYSSGTGWPSFVKPVDDKSVVRHVDETLGMVRTEVRSKKGNSHLGHVFKDGPKPTGLRYCINSAALKFINAKDLDKEGYGEYKNIFIENYQSKDNSEYAIVAGGCFWGIQHLFDEIEGIQKTVVGYTGGSLEYPTYSDVVNGNTGHAEAVLIKYDPKKISYEKVLDTFFKMHDPTTLNRQGPDSGSQYRSAIYYINKEQQKIAKSIINDIEKRKVFKNKIVTEVSAAKDFYRAEEYHQKFSAKTGRKSCHVLRK